MASSLRRTRQGREGFVLLAVLIVVVLLSLAAYQFSEYMMSEYRAADGYTRSAQARALADSGVHFAAAVLSNPESFSAMLGGNAFDNPEAFYNVAVGTEETRQGRFTIVAPPETGGILGGQGLRFGLVDEAGKINLNALLRIDSSGGVAHNMLMLLPQLYDREDIVNAILDWIDADDEPRTNGAENEHYSALIPGYRCKNGPLDSLDELLLVRGVTPELLFGNDRNRNGVLDVDEDPGVGALDRGLSEYLTVYSREQNVDSEGVARIYINDSDLQGLQAKLATALGEDLANYIIAYRIYGPASSSGQSGSGGTGGTSAGSGAAAPAPAPAPAPSKGSSSGGSGGSSSSSGGGGGSSGSGGSSSGSARLSRTMLSTQNARPRSISSLFDLINSSVSITTGSGQQQTTTTYPSPLNDAAAQVQLLPLLFDKVTTTRDAELPGRVNVNTAPEAVLRTLPGLADSDIQNILAFRPNPAELADPTYQTPAWLVTQANINTQALRTLERYITARTQVYRAQVLGYFDGGGPTARLEAVVDTNNGRPRVLYWRDLTELGRGIDLQTLGDRGTVMGR